VQWLMLLVVLLLIGKQGWDKAEIIPIASSLIVKMTR
jgi:hypothetical protein